MKTQKELKPIKLQSLTSKEVFYSFPHWTGKEVDGVEFTAVVKQQPSHERTQTLHYIRKDNLQKIT